MREDFDFVTFENYAKDMKESSDQAVAAVALIKARAEKAEQMLGYVLLATGKVEIPPCILYDPAPVEITMSRNDINMSYVLEAHRRS